MSNLFDGLGTEIITLILGLLLGSGAGGAIGYRIGVNKVRQTQKNIKASDKANVQQAGGNIGGKQ